ncbi:polysaccharide biosynthesis C-terminal domain-containing protein [Natronosalvus caseinilyticus]|uniref:oligosaccharide flippase family protein n=1 Tax=Natronosalvus caseinilyticus TaxID=2953747 RepID=UPI0028AD73FD|nr:polysaccharide biosynthesis C-terminal domain-containing protein [Natronosalvus caseinilyticus]
MDLERAGIVTIISRFLSTGIGFVGTIYYAQELGSTALGSFFLLQSLVGFLSIPADVGVQGAIEKRLSEGENKHRYFSAGLILLSVSYVIVALAIIPFSKSINDYLGMPLFLELLAVLFITIVYQLFLSSLRGELKIVHSALLEAVQALSTLLISIILLIDGYGVYALVYGLLAGKMLSSVLAIYLLDLSIVVPTTTSFRRIWDFSKYNTILRSSGLIYGWADTLIIGIFLSSSLVAIYEVAWRLSIVSIVVSGALSTVIFPNFSNLYSDSEIEEISTVTSRALTYVMIIPVGVFFGSLILSKEVLGVIYGAEFSAGWLVLILLTGERLIHAFHEIIYKITLALDQPDIAFRYSLLSILMNVILNIMLVPIIGIEGAAIAMITAYAVNALLYYRHIKNQIPLQIPFKNIWWILISGGIMALTVHYLSHIIQIDSIVKLSAIILIGGLVYFLSILLNSSIRSMWVELS